MSRVPLKRPCASCPYRVDVPSGLWAAHEYEKLPLYDEPTPYQPVELFYCHQDNGHLCAGWVACHDMVNSLAVRFAASRWAPDELGAVLDYTTDVPVFGSGLKAALHGLAGVADPDRRAQRAIQKLLRRRDLLQSRTSKQSQEA